MYVTNLCRQLIYPTHAVGHTASRNTHTETYLHQVIGNMLSIRIQITLTHPHSAREGERERKKERERERRVAGIVAPKKRHKDKLTAK